MNFATQRFTDPNPSCELPRTPYLWYLSQDGMDSEEVTGNIFHNMMYYQYSYRPYEDIPDDLFIIDDFNDTPVLHGPPPLSWVENESVFGQYFNHF